MERTFVAVKPDGVRRGLAGEVMRRFEAKGFRLAAVKLVTLAKEQAEEHYAEHKGKPFFGELVSFITSGPVLAMVLEGPEAVPRARLLIGATHPKDALPGTIRGDYCRIVTENLVHGSDSPASAEREIALWFHPGEVT